MLQPLVCSWIEQTDNLARFLNASRNIGPFEAIAMYTSQREILVFRGAAMLAGDDMVNLKWRWMNTGRQLTVLTTPIGALPNSTDKLRIQCACCNARRALDWIVAIRLLTWI